MEIRGCTGLLSSEVTYAKGARRHNFSVRWCDQRNVLEAVAFPDRQETTTAYRVLGLHHRIDGADRVLGIHE